MKKIFKYLFALTVGAFALTACTDPYAGQEVAEPKMYEQEALQDASFKASAAVSPLTIAKENIGKTFNLIKIDAQPALVSKDAQVEYKLIASNASDFANFKFVPVTKSASGNELVADYTALNDTLKKQNGTLAEHPVYFRVLAYVLEGSTRALYTTSNITINTKSYNYPPVAVDDEVTAIMNQVLVYNVLSNDSDPEGDNLTISAVGTAQNGTVSFSGSSIIYTPKNGFTGTDRFTYTVSDGNSTATAEVVITVTAMKPYSEVTVKPYYIIGLGDGAWNNSVAGLGVSIFPMDVVSGFVYNDQGNGIFSYTGYFEAGKGFKLIRDLGNWDEQWGAKDGVYVHNDGGSSDIKLATSGYYTINLNSVNHTLSIEPASAPANTFTKIGLIGGFNGWSGDEELKKYNNHSWYGEVTFDKDEEGKFRANSDWGTSWGATTFPVGVGVQNGANIPLKAGKYMVMFNDISGNFYFYKK